MPNIVFFSFTESDRDIVLTIKGRAVNPHYYGINFRVKDLLKRWNTDAISLIKQAISKAMYGTSRIIVFVGEKTHFSKWVREEVEITIRNNKPVYAIRIKNINGIKPKVLEEKDIFLYSWSEEKLQELATV